MSFTYDDAGNLATVTDPLQRVTSFTYDANGSRTGIVRPDSSTIDFSYDNNGNLTSLTVPNASEHTFGYTEVNRNSQYDVPADSGLSENIYHYYYDNDRRLVRTVMPSGNEIVNTYGNGKLQSIQTPEGETTFTYFCGSKVQSITRGDEAMAFTYDGSLLTSLSQTGELNATLEFAYDDDFDITSLTYAGGAVLYSYDNDGPAHQRGRLHHRARRRQWPAPSGERCKQRRRPGP